MKTLEELDHYELLEVERHARSEEIERAYTLVRAAYEGDSLAAYSLLAPDEAKLWRERIDEAWRVLADPATRRAYDATLAIADESGGYSTDADDEAPELPAGELAPLRIEAAEPAPAPSRPRDLPPFDADEDPEAPWDGARLRRARLLRGVDIEDLARVTKINPTYLRFLEEERFDDLPALVYVRGFVDACARHLGLDAPRIARSYAARCEEHRASRPRGRLLGRR
jgi:flagellar biosynthesis protein FlhG